ncbi:MAG: Phosphoglycerate transport system sensor protein PgtB [Firmicutes bacterium ADurb.Bin419]|nr:MAG: Phosphoglycerate transport system sensor protein PgtB [Firmicutes bacterium ADurb.Bin419]
MRDLSLHLMDIVQNSISAKASEVCISITADNNVDLLTMKIADNGEGIEESLLEDITSPFTTTRKTRKVGMGISLLKASSNMACGDLVIYSKRFEGTTVEATFKISHIDRLPLGDITETIVTLIIASPHIEFELVLSNEEDCFRFSTAEVKAQLKEVPITQVEVLNWIREYINSGIKIIFGGVLNEILS